MLKPKYTKLDNNLQPLPDDHPNDGPDKHLWVLVEKASAAKPVVVSAYRVARTDFSQGRKLAAVAVIGGRSCRGASIEELEMIADRTRTEIGLDTNFFPDAEGYEPTWSDDVDNSSPSGNAWYVILGVGLVGWSYQSFRYGVRAVCAGQS